DITLTAGAAVTGQVTFEGSPVSGELFVLAAADLGDAGKDVFRKLTGPTFTFENLEAGTYTIWFILAGQGDNKVARLDGVNVGADGVVDLGDVALSNDTPISSAEATLAQPALASLEPEALEDFVGPINEFVSVIDSENDYQNTGAALYPRSEEVESILIRSEVGLRIYWTDFLARLWGPEVGNVWLQYILSSPGNTLPRQTFIAGSQIIEGGWRSSGFRNFDAFVQLIDGAERSAELDLKRLFTDGSLSVERVQNEGVVILNLIDLPRAFDDTNGFNDFRNFNYSGVFSIPGTLAGGAGSIGQGTGNGGGIGQVYTDIRELDGFVILRPEGDDSVRAQFAMVYRAADTVDFRPGNIGNGLEQNVTGQLDMLEVFGDAFDIPFIARFDVGWDDVIITEVPSQNPSSPDGPPDRRIITTRRRSGDPNDILGPEGFG
ncbi:MAG: hypothetical protein MI741_14450, partial [Rhodospirillales bacterium]|nr:hypothetical protein [Rhodospirillales bacterium]